MMAWIDRIFNEHQLVRRLLVLWAITLITWVTVEVFADVTAINASINSALGLITGILATVIVHYQWSREREDKNANMDNR